MSTETNSERISIINTICSSLSDKDIERGSKIIKERYPFIPYKQESRKYSDAVKLRIFMRDGFIDRYSGDQLVFPGVLKIISNIYPNDFPYQTNWKMSECHMAWWHLYPTIDHMEPIAIGGQNHDKNLVSTSMMHNNIKSNFTLDELQWELHPPGNLDDWDGLLGWFMEYVKENQFLFEDRFIKKWYSTPRKLITY